VCIFAKNNRMSQVVIKVNTRTKAGKHLLETARIMAEKYEGIEFEDEVNEDELLKKMVRNRKKDVLSYNEKKSFLDDLNSVAEP